MYLENWDIQQSLVTSLQDINAFLMVANKEEVKNCVEYKDSICSDRLH